MFASKTQTKKASKPHHSEVVAGVDTNLAYVYKKVSSGKGSMRTTFACTYSRTPFQEGAISQVACCLHDEDYVAVATR